MYRKQLLCILLAMVTSASCAHKKVGEPGATASLPRNPAGTLYWIDEIGSTKNPTPDHPVNVSLSSDLNVVGWAVDRQAQAAAGGVDIVIDGTPYAASYGGDRTDVAEGQKLPAFRYTGFTFSTPAELLKGVHSIRVRILTTDQKSYYETPNIKVIIQ